MFRRFYQHSYAYFLMNFHGDLASCFSTLSWTRDLNKQTLSVQLCNRTTYQIYKNAIEHYFEYCYYNLSNYTASKHKIVVAALIPHNLDNGRTIKSKKYHSHTNSIKNKLLMTIQAMIQVQIKSRVVVYQPSLIVKAKILTILSKLTPNS